MNRVFCQSVRIPHLRVICIKQEHLIQYVSSERLKSYKGSVHNQRIVCIQLTDGLVLSYTKNNNSGLSKEGGGSAI